jgi:hypothetical protein
MSRYQKEQEKLLIAYIEKNKVDIFETSQGRYWISNVSMISLNIVRKFRNESWHWTSLSCNESISSKEKIETRHEFPWMLEYIIESMDDFLSCNIIYDKNHPFYFNFSKNNKNICEDVKLYPNFFWNWDGISLNRYVTDAFILEHASKCKQSYVAINPALSSGCLLQLKIPKELMAENSKIFNEKNFSLFFSNEEIKKSKRLQSNLTENLSISIDFILSHPEYPWNYELVQYRDDLSVQDIEKYPDFFRNYMKMVSCCKNIDKNFLLQNPATNLKNFYRWHHGLTLKDVMHLKVDDICSNLLQGTDEDRISFYRAYFAVKKIERAFLKCYWSTEYVWGRKRIEKEYEDLYQ